LLDVRRQVLCDYLRGIGQPWRDDSSNASPAYARNRTRSTLRIHPELVEPLLELARTCAALRDWTRASAPELPDRFAAEAVALLPAIVARDAARRWLVARGAPPDDVTPDVIERLVTMCADTAAAPRAQFPGGITVRRRSGWIHCDGLDDAG
jgi:hypothetical protein